MSAAKKTPRIIAIGGGKGGTGKSILAANVGVFLATLGKQVVAVDASLGSATLHLLLGASPPGVSLGATLSDLDGTLAPAVGQTPVPGLRLVAGEGDPLEMARPRRAQLSRLSERLRALDADYVVVDLASGTGSDVLDLMLDADLRIVVTVPEPGAVELTYRLVRALYLRSLHRHGVVGAVRDALAACRATVGGMPSPIDVARYFSKSGDADEATLALDALAVAAPRLVVNAARSKSDMELGSALAAAAWRRLGVPIGYLGHMEYDEAVWAAVRRRRPLLVEHPEARVSKCIEKVTRAILAARDRHGADVEVGESHYDLLEVSPTASFEDIRRANRRIRDIYGSESIVMSGLYAPDELEAVHRRFDLAYATLMDAIKRKEYDHELFPDGVPTPIGIEPSAAVSQPLLAATQPTVPRPPMPALTEDTVYSGPLLQRIREASGIELREIAERTKIGMGYLAAIEAEAVERLPAAVYIRGFLVEYAKTLALDIDRVVETFLLRVQRARAHEPVDDD